MKKTLIALFTVLTVLGNGLTALAAPETMPDGTVFDASYYAQNNPDVVAVLGTDRDALYNHYVTFGINEGRLPYEPGTEQAVESFSQTMKKSTGTTPTEVLVFLEHLGAQYPEFMLTDSHPIKANQWTERGIGFGNRPAYVSTYSYDSEGKLISMLVNGANPIYTYDAQGRVIHCEWFGSGVVDLKYDERGRIKKIEHKIKVNGVDEDVDTYNLKYDDSGLLNSMENGRDKIKYGYDTQNKLIWSSLTSNDYDERWDYDYDAFGRLIKKTECFTDDYTKQITEIVYSYDEQGKMIYATRYFNGKLREKVEFIYE